MKPIVEIQKMRVLRKIIEILSRISTKVKFKFLPTVHCELGHVEKCHQPPLFLSVAAQSSVPGKFYSDFSHKPGSKFPKIFSG